VALTETVPDVLDAAADRIDAAPGTNALDAISDALPFPASRYAQPERDQLAGDTYYALLAYLPFHVDLIGPWSDTETPDRVAQKLRQCARTLRKGGPARIEDQPPIPAQATVTNLVERAAHGNRRRKAPTFQSDAMELRHRRGVLASVLTRQRKANHPQPSKILETELAIGELDRQLAELEQGDSDARPAVAAGTWSGL